MSGKPVEMTSQIEAQIRAAVSDPELDTSNLVVFEARSITTEPVTTAQLFYSDARFTASTLKQMAEFINTPGNAIPLQIMHDTDVLPVGKVFSGQVYQMSNGESELRTLFYITKDRTQLINDINNSIIDEVSVGALPDHAFCSKCNFDFLSDEATSLQRIEGECGNGHVMGQDGAYAQLVGLSGWKELSLVNRGAAKKAKILSRASRSLAKENSNRLAARGIPLETVLLTASYKMDNINNNNKPGESEMTDTKELLAGLTAAVTEATEAKASLKTTTEQLNTVTAELATVKEKNAELETQLKEVDKEKLIETAKTAETKLKEAAEKMRPHVEAALVASGASSKDLKEDMDLVAMLSLIEEKGLKLHQAVQAKSDVKDDQLKAGMSDKYSLAFKTRK